jgi:hypothetical protein
MEDFRSRLHLPYYDYIPQRGLKNLAKYKYSSLDLSIIAKYILHPFWTWLANFLPEWPAYALFFSLDLYITPLASNVAFTDGPWLTS